MHLLFGVAYNACFLVYVCLSACLSVCLYAYMYACMHMEGKYDGV